MKSNKIYWDFIVHPFGIPIALTWPQFWGALSMVNRYPPALFVELGVYKGGLGSLLITRCKYYSRFHYLGVDQHLNDINPVLRGMADGEPRFSYLIGDIYSDEVILAIEEAIRVVGGKTIIFCDGGDKLDELKIFSNYLKREGDIIFAHDYPGTYDDGDLLFLQKDFDELDVEFFKDGIGIPAFIRKRNA